MKATDIIALLAQVLPVLTQLAGGIAAQVEAGHPAADHLNKAAGALSEASTHLTNATNATQTS